MRVNRLEIDGFRNLKTDSFCPAAGVNILFGQNAQGKTNLLEALWLFTGGRSFRSSRDADMIRFGNERALLKLVFEAKEREQEAELRIAARRSAVLNGVPQKSTARLAGRFCGVIFSPVHLSLIQDGPEGRRRFLDAAYCQIRPGYLPVLADYQRTLLQRNTLLKDMRKNGLSSSLLDVWDQKLAESGARVVLARRRYIQRLQPQASAIYEGLSGGKEQLTLSYQCTAGEQTTAEKNSVLQLYEAIARARTADLAAGFSTVGPHRDDLYVGINELSARTFGSQGQQRSAVLALKLSEASVLREVTGEQPVALLDDVMSELDESRQDYILNHIHGWQVLITCCEPSAVMRLTGGATFHVKQGEIQQIS